jgi:nucleolar protein 4
MLSKKDAEGAIQGCNAKLVRAGTAETMISDKQKKKKQKRLEKKSREVGRVKEEDVLEGEEKLENEKATKMTERVVTVDWALSKDKWEGEKAKMEQQVDEDVDMNSVSSREDDDESEGEQEEHLGVHSGSDEDDDDDNALSRDEEDDDRGDTVKPSLPATDIGTTVFVRNIPFTTTEDEIRTLFRAFGPLRYARVTMDLETSRSRGTGFVCFWNREDADRVIEQSELLRMEMTGNTPVVGTMLLEPYSKLILFKPVKKNPFVLPSILTPDPSSSLAQSLVLHGRTLDVVRAVTRSQALTLKDQGEKARQKADKRNIYLLKEGG